MAEDLQQGQLYKSSWRREVSGEVTGICGFSCCVNTMQLKTPKHPFATSCCVTSSELVTFLSLSHLYNRANTISWSERCRFRKITEGSAWAQKTLKFLSPSKHHWILTGNNRGMTVHGGDERKGMYSRRNKQHVQSLEGGSTQGTKGKDSKPGLDVTMVIKLIQLTYSNHRPTAASTTWKIRESLLNFLGLKCS